MRLFNDISLPKKSPAIPQKNADKANAKKENLFLSRKLRKLRLLYRGYFR